MTEKRHVGRPKLNDSERKSKTYFVRFREAEYDELKTKATGAGVSVASYIREQVLERKGNDSIGVN